MPAGLLQTYKTVRNFAMKKMIMYVDRRNNTHTALKGPLGRTEVLHLAVCYIEEFSLSA